MLKQEEDCPARDLKEYVTAGTCKLVTDALNEKIAVQKLLVDAEIGALRTAFYAALTTATLILSALEIILRIWKG